MVFQKKEKTLLVPTIQNGYPSKCQSLKLTAFDFSDYTKGKNLKRFSRIKEQPLISNEKR